MEVPHNVWLVFFEYLVVLKVQVILQSEHLQRVAAEFIVVVVGVNFEFLILFYGESVYLCAWVDFTLRVERGAC